MRYLLDTCVVSDFVKGDADTSQRLKSISPEDIAVSAITSMELKYGLANNPQRAVKIQPLIDSFLSSVSILTFGEEEAKQTAQILDFRLKRRKERQEVNVTNCQKSNDQ
jgi:tRNA(fMet)-specific endonuclease VapC